MNNDHVTDYMLLKAEAIEPLERKAIRLRSGQTVLAVTRGSGPLVVFLHGWSHGLSRWNFLSASVARQFTFVAIDLPGFGSMAGAPVERPYVHNLASFVEDLCLAMVDQLEQPIDTIVSHSLGACATVLALQRASFQNLDIKRLVAVGAPLQGIPIVRFLSPLWPIAVAIFALRSVPPDWLSSFGIKVVGLLTTRSWSAMDATFVADVRAPSTLFLANTLFSTAWHRTPLNPRPSAKKVWLVSGTHDWLVTKRDHSVLARHWKATLMQIERASHTPFMEQPQLFAETLKTILSERLD